MEKIDTAHLRSPELDETVPRADATPAETPSMYDELNQKKIAALEAGDLEEVARIDKEAAMVYKIKEAQDHMPR